MPELKPKIVMRKLANLVPYARNSRTHSEQQISDIAGSIREFGFTNPVLIRMTDGTISIVAGHARVMASRMLGLEEVPTLDLSHLTEAQARAYVIADNRLAETAGWDFETLALEFEELESEGFELDVTGFDLDARKGVAKRAQQAADDREFGQDGENDFGTVPMHPISRPGDIWHIGPHRLICADSLHTGTMETLIGDAKPAAMITDPPYAIYGSATGMASDIADDKMVRPFFEKVIGLGRDHLPWFAHIYMFCDWRSWASIWESAKRISTIEPKNMIVWDKGGADLGSNYANTHELIAFFSKLPPQEAKGDRSAGQRTVHASNVMRHNRPSGDEREHNAAKPVALMRDLIQNSTGPGDTILEPFNGSGTTMVAADQTERVCLACDLEPKWVDVTIGRMLRLREIHATLGEDGPTYQEVAQQRETDGETPQTH